MFGESVNAVIFPIRPIGNTHYIEVFYTSVSATQSLTQHVFLQLKVPAPSLLPAFSVVSFLFISGISTLVSTIFAFSLQVKP